MDRTSDKDSRRPSSRDRPNTIARRPEVITTPIKALSPVKTASIHRANLKLVLQNTYDKDVVVRRARFSGVRAVTRLTRVFIVYCLW